MTGELARWAWAEIDLDAIAHNVGVVRSAVAPSATWAVVKADAYGHGAVAVATRALAAGADGLCVALVQEGAELRRAGITAPIVLLSEQPADQADEIVTSDLQPTVSTAAGADALAAAARRVAPARTLTVHLKVDTGMHRAGIDPDGALALVAAIDRQPVLLLGSIFTHLAMADEPRSATNQLQLERFDTVLAKIRATGRELPLVHIANSAAALALPEARRDVVRLGIAMYGIEPGPAVADLCTGLRPALSLHARVSSVRTVAAGEGVSYGWRHVFDRPTVVATVPIGYADGVPRRLFGTGGQALVHGARLPIVGVVTMDQLMLDCGDLQVRVGDEVVLLGRQTGPAGSDEIRAEEWAARLGTIGYEIVCGISKRIARRPRNAS